MRTEHLFHLHARRRRAQIASLILIVGLGGLGAAFFDTQVIQNSTYALRSEANRLRPMPVPAPRGTVYDRYGAVLADNVPGYTLSLLPAPPESLRTTLARLAPHLDLSERQIEDVLARQRRFSSRPVVVSNDLSFDQVAALEERRPLFPGIFIDTRPKRRYPAGPVMAHVLGYVGEISEAELQSGEYGDAAPGRMVGKAGVERAYDSRLGGTPGLRYIEVDARGRVVGSLAPQAKVAPAPGRDLRLHIDLELQRWIAEIFPDTLRGAIVAIEPGTGQVLAMYSHPSYDPNLFVGGVAPEQWDSLKADPGDPLVHRATAGLYPPGSTWKLATAAIGLELGIIEPDDHMAVPCRGGMQYGARYFRCWERDGHGYVDLADAIKHSCNVYFYQLGLQIGLERLLTEASRLGFRTPTGIDLPVEKAGTFPSEPGWYRERFGWSPSPAEVLSLAIGQGPNDQTALRMAQFYAALAGDGRAPAPRIGAAPAGAADGIELDIAPEHLDALREGLGRVAEPEGTAHGASLEHWDLAGKTGTAQNSRDPERDHAWFVGMAGPKDAEPEVVVSVILELGEHGSTAAQFGAKTADYYLRRKYGIPTDTIQTLREHIMARKRAPWARWN